MRGAARNAGRRRPAVKETVTTTPRDIYLGDRQVLLRWRKNRWICGNPRCQRKTFTESLPAVPRPRPADRRLRARLGEAVGDELMPAAAAARRYGVSDRTAAAAFTAYADAQLADLGEHQEPVEAAGIDEFRRGIPGPAAGDGQARSQWFTHLVDLGTGGTLGLAQERTGEAGKGLLNDHESKLRYLAMDLSAPYRSAAPAGVTVIADAFHLVKLANRKIRRGVPPARLPHRARARGTSACPARCTTCSGTTSRTWTRTTWTPSSATLDGDGDGQQIAAVWIAKEQLRALLALRATKTHVTPAPSAGARQARRLLPLVRGPPDIPEIKTLAATIEKWQQPVIDAVLTGYSNAKAEAHNRTAKMVARTARGFANPQNQARRVRMATTRAARQARRPSASGHGKQPEAP